MAKLLRAVAAGFLAFTGCSADDTMSMVQQSVATDPAIIGKRTKKEEWKKAQEEAGAAFRAERVKQFEVYRIQEQMAEERRQKKLADAAEMEEMKAQQQAQEAAEKKAKQDELSALRLQLKEQHAAKLKEKRHERAALRTSVKESHASKEKLAQIEQAEVRNKVKQQIKQDLESAQPAKTNARWQAQPTAEQKKGLTYGVASKKSLIHLNFVDKSGNKMRLRLPKILQMSKVMSTAGKRLGVDWEHTSFMHDGKSLAAAETLESSGLQDDDTVDVVPQE